MAESKYAEFRGFVTSLAIFPVLLAGTVAAQAVDKVAKEQTSAPASATRSARKVVEAVDIAPVWAGHPVRFALLTHGEVQFVGFYDADRQMTVGRRALDSTEWELVRLPEKIEWDSHNYITMALDADKYLHVSGNMHNVPLVYFRAHEPLDIASLDRVTSMTGEREQSCTYPSFIEGPVGELIFTYRDGASGNGDQIFNVYDTSTRRWRRLIDEPLASGEGAMNAYFHGPVRGPDGFFHLCWVWRDTPDSATNHDLCYARSRDLISWETGSGRSLELPITLKTAEVVDPVPAGGGMINGNTVIGFDNSARPIITYHKYDAEGNTQIYNARLEDGRWNITRCSDWDYRWDFSGGGTLGAQVRVSAVEVDDSGRLIVRARNPKDGSTGWILDESTLEPMGAAPPPPRVELGRWRARESDFPGMGVRWASDLGTREKEDDEYRLRWETLSQNRDKPREDPLPEPSMLRVLKLANGSVLHSGN